MNLPLKPWSKMTQVERDNLLREKLDEIEGGKIDTKSFTAWCLSKSWGATHKEILEFQNKSVIPDATPNVKDYTAYFKGYTLIEILIAVALVAMVASIVIMGINASRKSINVGTKQVSDNINLLNRSFEPDFNPWTMTNQTAIH